MLLKRSVFDFSSVDVIESTKKVKHVIAKNIVVSRFAAEKSVSVLLFKLICVQGRLVDEAGAVPFLHPVVPGVGDGRQNDGLRRVMYTVPTTRVCRGAYGIETCSSWARAWSSTTSVVSLAHGFLFFLFLCFRVEAGVETSFAIREDRNVLTGDQPPIIMANERR